MQLQRWWIRKLAVLASAFVLTFGLIVYLSLNAVAQPLPTKLTASLPREFCDRATHQHVLHAASPDGVRSGAHAVWLNRRLLKWPGVDGSGTFRLYHSLRGQIVAKPKTRTVGFEGVVSTDLFFGDIPADIAARFKYVANGVVLSVRDGDAVRMAELHKQQIVLVNEDGDGNVLDATTLQIAGALDDQYSGASRIEDFGVTVTAKNTRFRIWAPTAHAVTVCVYKTGTGKASQTEEMLWDAGTGAWSAAISSDHSREYYTYLVDVNVAGVGLVRNRVTDPYSISLTTDSARSYIADLRDPLLKPRGWDNDRAMNRVKAQTDMVIYELHVRDFSINDMTVPRRHRGKYAAFNHIGSLGMKHLKTLSDAGMTDVHLLPVFDFATVPEADCVAPRLDMLKMVADGEAQQAAVMAQKDRDCFNWGYDPFHYTAPEGSYATNASDGARRIIELRQMVAALHRIGLRVGMDVVYNHTSAAGQDKKSVLDRIVPGYYHRLNASGAIEKSTCCENTATENIMMAKLMADSVVTWAREYKIDSFRFDLMGHQPRSAMEELKVRLNAATGRDIQLIGEGWNFGEVADGARFVQASQLSLNGSGIGTFSDRARDAVRGGGAADNGLAMVKRQGYINGLGYDRNAPAGVEPRTDELLRAADMVRVGLAGSIRDYPLKTYRDEVTPLHRIDYSGQPAGYASEPAEAVNYVENHDNQTLFDINVYKLPVDTSREDRARVQILALAINAFSQGVAYFHAGVDLLRSKSMDRNSFDSGDWFNRIDWSGHDNYFATGAPPKADNVGDYGLIKPLLANPRIKPTPAEIAWTRNAFRDLLKIRASTSLFRLQTSAEIISRLTFYNIGAKQTPTLLVGHLNGAGHDDARFGELIYLINVDKVAQEIRIDEMVGKSFILHPVHSNSQAADQRVRREARFDSATGVFRVPARSAAVFVIK